MYAQNLYRRNLRLARFRWGPSLGRVALEVLRMYSEQFQLSVASGDLLFLEHSWYVTHAGLLRLSRRSRCSGIAIQPVIELCNQALGRYAFRAVVYTSRYCRGFVGYGDADPANVSPSRPRCRDARRRDTRRKPRPPKGLRHRYLLGRGTRFFCRINRAGSGVEEASTTPNEWKLWWSQST